MNIFKRIWYAIITSNDDPFIKKIDSLNNVIDTYINQLNECKKLKDQISQSLYERGDTIEQLRMEVFSLKDSLKSEEEKGQLQLYWENKRPKDNNYRYKARCLSHGNSANIFMDPRIFFSIEDSSIPIIHGNSNDEIAYSCLRYVRSNIRYKTDTEQFKSDEEWLFAFETQVLRKGDCEDGAIYLANIMKKSGIPYWRIRLNAGDVKGGGHCWLTYLKEENNQWYIMDWCYWPDKSLKGLSWKDAEDYFDIWFSFNEKDIYVSDKLDREI